MSFRLLIYNEMMAILKEIMVENVQDLKTNMSPDNEGVHQVINWKSK